MFLSFMKNVNNKKIGLFKGLKVMVLFLLGLIPQAVKGQNPEGFKEMAIKMANKSVPIISLMQIDEIEKKGKKIIYLDARELEEFNVSHIKGAIHVGYDNFKEDEVKNMDKNAVYVVYCSVGYRSGKIGKKMQKMGFKYVFNLYGGIFNWANNDRAMIKKGNKTVKAHPFNKKWGKWLRKELWEGIED